MKDNLILGNIDSAIECLYESNRKTEALLLAGREQKWDLFKQLSDKYLQNELEDDQEL